jgi:hypothetical protein
LDHLTSEQLSEWQAYNKINPIDTSWRKELQMAQLISLIHNVVNAIYCAEGSQPINTTAKDFMPNWDGENEVPEVKKSSPEEILAIFKGVAKENKKRQEREERLNKVKPKIKPKR